MTKLKVQMKSKNKRINGRVYDLEKETIHCLVNLNFKY